MLPDWLPNIHPLIVHFPIALLVTAVLLDLARLIKIENGWLQNTSDLLYTAGTIGLGVAFYSGKQAVKSVLLSGGASATAATHEDWALYTLIYFAIFTATRLWLRLKKIVNRKAVSILFAVAGLSGIALLWQTAENGAKLVFRYGVAIHEIDKLMEENKNLKGELSVLREQTKPQLVNGGGWYWSPGPLNKEDIQEAFTIEGDDGFSVISGRENGRRHVSFQPGNGASFLLFGEPMKAVEGLAEINTEQFQGSVMIVHHFRDTESYQYLKVQNDILTQGQVINGRDEVLQSGSIDTDGWITLRVSAAGTHFYGYKNNESITHTHGREMQEGLAGFAFSGSGTLQLRMVEFSRMD